MLRWEHRRWAVEGCHGAGRSLAQRLVADGELVLDVAAKLAARVRVYPGGHGRETEKDDAVSIGLAALDGAGIMAVRPDDALVSLRLLCDRREELTAARTQAVCRPHRLLAELTPGGMRRELCASKTQALLAGIRPGDEVGKVRMEMARDHLAGIRALDARLKAIEAEIAALVTTLTSMYGIGPVIAGRILAETGDISRFATKDKFASYNGTASIDGRRPGPAPAVPVREPQDEPRPAQGGRLPDPQSRLRRASLLRAQTTGRHDTQRSAQMPQTAAVRSGSLPAPGRRQGHNQGMRITYDPAAEAV